MDQLHIRRLPDILSDGSQYPVSEWWDMRVDELHAYSDWNVAALFQPLCLKVSNRCWIRVSTTCGWVNRQNSKSKNIACSSSTHPVPQVVLTSIQG